MFTVHQIGMFSGGQAANGQHTAKTLAQAKQWVAKQPASTVTSCGGAGWVIAQNGLVVAHTGTSTKQWHKAPAPQQPVSQWL